MKAPNSQSFGVARAILEHRAYTDGHIVVEVSHEPFSETDLTPVDMETIKFFGCEVMHIVHTAPGPQIAGCFGGWPDSSKLRQLMNSILMRLGIKRRVGVYRGAPHLYRTVGDNVDPIRRVSSCEWFSIWTPSETE